jgi:hypothetical protein
MIMIVSTKTRWIVAATGCTTAITGIPVLSWLSAFVSGFLIVGAVLARRFPRTGRDLIWFGAGLTSLWVIPVGIGFLYVSLKGGRDPRIIAAALVSVLLVVACDTALVKEAFGQRLTTDD